MTPPATDRLRITVARTGQVRSCRTPQPRHQARNLGRVWGSVPTPWTAQTKFGGRWLTYAAGGDP